MPNTITIVGPFTQLLSMNILPLKGALNNAKPEIIEQAEVVDDKQLPHLFLNDFT